MGLGNVTEFKGNGGLCNMMETVWTSVFLWNISKNIDTNEGFRIILPNQHRTLKTTIKKKNFFCAFILAGLSKNPNK